MVVAAVGGEELHEVVRVGVIGAPTVAKYGKGIILQLFEIDFPLLILQSDDYPQVSLPHSLDRFGDQLSIFIVVVTQDDAGESFAFRVAGSRSSRRASGGLK